MRLWKWLWVQFLTRPLRVLIVAVIIVVFGPLIGIALPKDAEATARVVGAASATTLVFLAGLILLVKLISALLPKETSAAAAAVINVVVILYFAGFPLLIAVQASSGSNLAAIASWGEGVKGGVPGWVMVLMETVCQLGIMYLLVVFPGALRRRLPWDHATELAQSLLPAWLAAAGVGITWLYVLLLHFGDGPLAKTSLAVTLVGGLGLAVLLAPLYQFMARSCWQYGGEAVLDPVRWLAAWRKVAKEILPKK